MTPSDPPPLPPKPDDPAPAKAPDPPPVSATPTEPPVIAPAPPPLPAKPPEYKLEAKARYDDAPAPPPAAPPAARKPTVIAAAAAPVIVADRPPAPDLPVAKPVGGGDYDVDPGDFDVEPPTGMHPLIKAIFIVCLLVVLLPVAGLAFLFALCAFGGP